MIFLGKTARSAPFANVPTATRVTSYTELVQVVREHILEKYGTRWPEQIKSPRYVLCRHYLAQSRECSLRLLVSLSADGFRYASSSKPLVDISNQCTTKRLKTTSYLSKAPCIASIQKRTILTFASGWSLGVPSVSFKCMRSKCLIACFFPSWRLERVSKHVAERCVNLWICFYWRQRVYWFATGRWAVLTQLNWASRPYHRVPPWEEHARQDDGRLRCADLPDELVRDTPDGVSLIIVPPVSGH